MVNMTNDSILNTTHYISQTENRPKKCLKRSEGLYSLQRTVAVNPNLVLVKFLIDQFVLSLFLEGNDNQGNKDVDKEEGKNNEVDNVENGHLHFIARLWSHVLLRRIDRMP